MLYGVITISIIILSGFINIISYLLTLYLINTQIYKISILDLSLLLPILKLQV
jgi:hypothetical protein